MDIPWKRSTRCSSNGCVEVTNGEGVILVRNSKRPEEEPLSFQPQTWISTVIAPVMLDRLPNCVVATDEGGVEMSGHTVEGEYRVLHFDRGEWAAFKDGAKAGEFTFAEAAWMKP